MIIKKRCPYCNKQIEVQSEIDLGTSVLLTFACNHTVVEVKLQKVEATKVEALRSLAGDKLLPFQIEGVNFAFSSNVNCLIADEMGLGKTIEALATIALDKPNLLPALIICKAIARTNWLMECLKWVPAISQIVEGSKTTFHEQYKIHIISFDLLFRLDDNESFQKIVKRAKTVIIDESHLIKSNTAKRTVALKSLIHPKNGSEGFKPKHVIGLSGTPIKNNATEYFTILNILKPERYNNFASFCWANVEQYFDARGNAWKYGGLKNPAGFKEKTKDFIIRRTMDEVLPDLPKVWKQFHYVDMEEDVQKIYDKEWKEFTEFYEENEGHKDFSFYNNIMAKMARLRHLTGLAKIDFCLDNLVEFLGSTERKITVFVHHKDVGSTLVERLTDICKQLDLPGPLVLRAEDKSHVQEIIDNFKDGPSRILVASTLASGESINLQFCSDVVMHERQWNPANEEQAASGRFRRIGQKADKVSVNFLVAVGTIDEYFAELVERKRQIFEETMSGEEANIPWDEQSIIKDLAAMLVQKGREKWSIHK